MSSTHGGAQFEVLGDDLSRLELCGRVVPADVLDAWFDPAPGVLDVLRKYVAWSCRTSPPASPSGLEKRIALAEGVPSECVVIGAGSSELIYRALTRWLSASSRAFVLDPTYSEYRHVCSHIVGCRVESDSSLTQLKGAYDLIVIVNPNNPTSELFSVNDIESTMMHLTPTGIVWVDEAYMPYVQQGRSAKLDAVSDPRILVCQSLSKSLALSGMRVAYLVAHPQTAVGLRSVAPPWIVGTATTLAVTAALEDAAYYLDRYSQTRDLRAGLAQELSRTAAGKVTEGAANWLCINLHVPAACVVDQCRRFGVFVRDGSGMFTSPPVGFVRVAVRSQSENRQITAAFAGSGLIRSETARARAR